MNKIIHLTKSTFSYKSLFKKYSSKVLKKTYFESFDFNQISMTEPAGYIPPEIKRPKSVTVPDYQPNQSTASIITEEGEVNKLREACRIAAKALQKACEMVEEGITTEDLDKVIHSYIVSQNAYPSGVGYLGFPKSVCTSINEIACHGIPNKRKLKKGDFLNIDVTAYYEGYHGDTSAMVFVGEAHPDLERLVRVTREALFKAISICKVGEKVSTIAKVIEKHVTSNGFTVCKEFCGHGVGSELHMRPQISHYFNKDNPDFIMVPGLTFTIEPIVMMYPYEELYLLEDNWTVYCPNNPSAQWEHIVHITENGFEVLTKRENEIMLI